jgi:hypothetical protein
MTKISKTKEYAIKWLYSQQHPAEEIASEVKASIEEVQEIINQVISENPPKKIASPDLMIRHTASKGTNSVSIMTREASQLNDATKKNNIAPARNIEKSIFRPKK